MSQGSSGGLKARLAALKEFRHVAAESDQSHVIRDRAGLGLAKVSFVGFEQIDDPAAVIKGADALLVLPDKRHEFHRTIPFDGTTS